MEKEESLRIQSLRKPQTPQQTQKITRNGVHLNECLKKENSTALKDTAGKDAVKVELLPKPEELNGKREKENISVGAAPRRPSTATGGSRRRAVSGEKERSPSIPMSKSFSVQSKNNNVDRRSIGSASSTPASTTSKVKKQSLMKNKAKSPAKISFKIEDTEDFESTGIFPQAVYEQGQIIEMLHLAREELREKMVQKVQLKTAAAPADKAECLSLQPPHSQNFENAYSGTLEEIFQAWANLFYFIINLKFNFIRVLNSAGTEPFRPNTEIEREVVGQAIECVKFFSILKIKSLVNSLEELHLPDKVNETQIKDYEEQVSSLFLFEMDFIQKKAKEILEQAKKEKVCATSQNTT